MFGLLELLGGNRIGVIISLPNGKCFWLLARAKADILLVTLKIMHSTDLE